MLESDFLTFEFNIMEVVHPGGGGGGGEDATDLIIIPIPGTSCTLLYCPSDHRATSYN